MSLWRRLTSEYLIHQHIFHSIPQTVGFCNFTKIQRIWFRMASNSVTTASDSVKQPKWLDPSNEATKLRIYNSLTREKNEFHPRSKDVNPSVGWYSCGPTVYDHSHLGHARAYITFDILRRLISNYFGYNVTYVMNITDIDDKIIKGARYQYLFSKFRKTHENDTDFSKVFPVVLLSWSKFATKYFSALIPSELHKLEINSLELLKSFFFKNGFDPLIAFDKSKIVVSEDDPKLEMRRKQLVATSKIIIDAIKLEKGVFIESKVTVLELIDATRDILVEYLDLEEGTTVNDPKIFREFSSFWENQYFEDMDNLNILRPDILTRVSEYVPEIIEYVEGIINNGYGYSTSDGSVYFDTSKFASNENHFYAKLQPWSANNTKLLNEGEGELSNDGGKRNPADFALWKASKPGEPRWNSPWGLGRPGWHIECSAMASNVLGEKLDIHSGGIDLAFPHHDNELAQAEGYHNCKQWVNYFIHAGHLHIEGQKMSKSLKNFVTIKEALKDNTAAQIRYMFLLHQWNATLDYSKGSMNEARAVESTFNNFLTNVKAILANQSLTEQSKKQSLNELNFDFTNNEDNGNRITTEVKHEVNEKEKEILQLLEKTHTLVHEALSDSFNTPIAIQLLRDLVSQTNLYINDKLKTNDHPSPEIIRKVASYITNWLRVFGIFKDINPIIGEGSSESSNNNAEESALKYIKVLANFREKIRKISREIGNEDLLKACDDLRDYDLVDVGISLDDRGEGNETLIKFIDREELIRKREEKIKLEKEKQEAKEKRLLELLEKKKEKLNKGKLSPQDLFKSRTDEFSKFDESGLPTHDNNGEELTKGKKKKLEKEYKVQEKLHQEYLAYIAEGNTL